MIIKRAKLKDLESIFKLHKLLDQHYNYISPKKENQKWHILNRNLINNKNKGGIFLVILNKSIIGYISYYFEKRKKSLCNCLFINELYIKSKYRNKGIATKLVQKIFKVKLPSFVKRYTVTTEPKAKGVLSFYKKMGFKINGKTKAGNVLLNKEL